MTARTGDDERETTIACAQIAPRLGDVDANIATSLAAVESAADRGARVVVLPELAATGYAFADQAEARAAAERDGGRAVAAWAELSRRRALVIVGGFAELGEDGALHNSAAVLDGGELRAVYRKTHLWGRERELFAAGEHEPPVVETSAGRIGVAICYDVYFPDLVAGIAERGADLLCLPTNAPRSIPDGPAPPAAGGHLYPAQLSIYITFAHLLRMAIAACDRVGTERGIDWVGASAVVDETGWMVAGPPRGYGAGVITGQCRLSRARDKRRGPHNHVFADARLSQLAPAPPQPRKDSHA